MNEGRVLTVAGAKGGVGKSTTSLNLAAALAAAGTSVVVVEADLAMANDADYLDLAVGTDLHEVLAGEAEVADAIHETDAGFDVVPSGTDIDGFVNADVERLPEVIDALRTHYHLVVVDTGAGIDKAALRALACADVTVLVSTPRIAAVRDAAKTVELADRVGGEVAGVVFCRDGTANSPPVAQIADYLGVDLLGHIPEDDAVAAAQDAGQVVVAHAPASAAATAYHDAASRLVQNLVDPSVGGVSDDPGVDEGDLTAPADREDTQSAGGDWLGTASPGAGSASPGAGSASPGAGSTDGESGATPSASGPATSPRSDAAAGAGEEQRQPREADGVAGNGRTPGAEPVHDSDPAVAGHAPDESVNGTGASANGTGPSANGTGASANGTGASPSTETTPTSDTAPGDPESTLGATGSTPTGGRDTTADTDPVVGDPAPNPEPEPEPDSAGEAAGEFATAGPSDEDITAALDGMARQEAETADGPTDEEIAAAIEQATDPDDAEGPSDEEIAAAIDDARRAEEDEGPKVADDGPEMVAPDELSPNDEPEEDDESEPDVAPELDDDEPKIDSDEPELDGDDDAGFVFPATDGGDADE